MFRVTDPQGNIIILTRECWKDHICNVHTEMKTRLDEIRETVLLVAVQRRANQKRGFIQSAYPVKSLSKGGVLEWKKP